MFEFPLALRVWWGKTTVSILLRKRGSSCRHGTTSRGVLQPEPFRKLCPDGEEVQHFVNLCNKEYFYIPSPLWLCCEAWMSCVPASTGCCNPLDSVAEGAPCRGCGHVSALPGAGLVSGCHRVCGSQLCPLGLVELCWACCALQGPGAGAR